jgi:hypothetical protein
MGNLSDEQRSDIREFLISSGLTFKPLLSEMCDHIACDIEDRMKTGMSYKESWAQVVNTLPNDHFKIIQQETMETINKRFTLSRALTYVGLSTLFLALAFKVMHLPMANELLIISYTSLAVSLLFSSVSGIYLNREKKGALLVMGVVAGTIILLSGYAFLILHLPGAYPLVLAGVIVSMVAMLFNTFYVYKHASGIGNLFTFLHEKHSPGIERFLLLLLLPTALYRIVALVTQTQYSLAVVVLLIVIYASGLQFIALTWSGIEKDLRYRHASILFSVIAAIICLVIPFAGELVPFYLRLTTVTLFSFFAASLALRFEPVRSVSWYLAYLIPALFTLMAMVKIGWISSFIDNTAFNIIVIGLMIAGIFFSRKGGIMRAYFILSLAGYLTEALVPTP